MLYRAVTRRASHPDKARAPAALRRPGALGAAGVDGVRSQSWRHLWWASRGLFAPRLPGVWSAPCGRRTAVPAFQARAQPSRRLGSRRAGEQGLLPPVLEPLPRVPRSCPPSVHGQPRAVLFALGWGPACSAPQIQVWPVTSSFPPRPAAGVRGSPPGSRVPGPGSHPPRTAPS